jgi:hypothetical protein
MTPTERELMALRAETLALQAILTNVFYELKSLDPLVADAIGRGFDYAASQIENMTIHAGEAVPAVHLAKALGIIEELQTASLGRHNKPRHGV